MRRCGGFSDGSAAVSVGALIILLNHIFLKQNLSPLTLGTPQMGASRSHDNDVQICKGENVGGEMLEVS